MRHVSGSIDVRGFDRRPLDGGTGGSVRGPIRRPGVRLAFTCALLTATLGCGLARRTAVSTMIPILDNSVAAAYRNGDVDLVEAGLPGNLLLVDGLVATRPDDRRLLALASQLYCSYGIGFVELGNPERAEGLYETARGYGWRAYPELDPARSMGIDGEATFAGALAALGPDDVPAATWLTASWASWIKLNLSRPAALAELPRVTALAERLIELDPTFLHGLPHLMLGTILALRPEPMGGEPDRALGEFEKAFAVSDRKFLLTHIYFARYYCRQIFDEELFDRTVDELMSADPDALPDALLLNRVAQRQGQMLRDMRDELF